jgi:hypothetical protein
MTEFNTIIFKLQLHQSTGEWVDNIPLFAQFYSFTEQKWINLYRGEIENGLFYIKSAAKSTVKSKASFFELLRNGHVPLVRLVPTENLLGNKKKEVIGTTFSFSLNQKDISFEFDFGSLWLVPKEWTFDHTNSFRDFVLIASPFPLKNAAPEISNNTEKDTTEELYQTCRKELAYSSAELKTIQTQYQTLYTANEELKKNYSQLKEQKNSLDADLLEVRSQLKKQQNTILQLESKIQDLTKNNNQENSPVPIKNLYSDIVNEIEVANKFTESSSFKLSNISLKLKAIIQKDGDALSASLLDISNSEKVNGNSISELVFDITPVRNVETAIGKMPDVIGLTETAVRRILKSIDLRLNPVYQSNPNVVNGDSFKQSPTPGTDIQANQLITVIFSKHEQQ